MMRGQLLIAATLLLLQTTSATQCAFESELSIPQQFQPAVTSFCSRALQTPVASITNAPAPMSSYLAKVPASEITSICSCIVNNSAPQNLAATSTCSNKTVTTTAPARTLTHTLTATATRTACTATRTNTVSHSVIQTITHASSTVTVPGSTVTQTITHASSTVTVPGSTVTLPATTITSPGSTVTVPGSTVTLPGSTVTQPGSTVTVPGSTVTLPGSTVTQKSTVTLPASTVTLPPVTKTQTLSPSTVTLPPQTSTVTLPASTVTTTATATTTVTAAPSGQAIDQNGCPSTNLGTIFEFDLYCGQAPRSDSFAYGQAPGYSIEDCASQCFYGALSQDCLGVAYVPPSGGAFSIIDGHLIEGTCTFYEFITAGVPQDGIAMGVFQNDFARRKQKRDVEKLKRDLKLARLAYGL